MAKKTPKVVCDLPLNVEQFVAQVEARLVECRADAQNTIDTDNVQIENLGDRLIRQRVEIVRSPIRTDIIDLNNDLDTSVALFLYEYGIVETHPQARELRNIIRLSRAVGYRLSEYIAHDPSVEIKLAKEIYKIRKDRAKGVRIAAKKKPNAKKIRIDAEAYVLRNPNTTKAGCVRHLSDTFKDVTEGHIARTIAYIFEKMPGKGRNHVRPEFLPPDHKRYESGFG